MGGHTSKISWATQSLIYGFKKMKKTQQQTKTQRTQSKDGEGGVEKEV